MCQLFRPQLCYRLFVSNSAFLSFEVEYCSSHLTMTTLTFFYVIGYCYTFIFASELGLRLIANLYMFLYESVWNQLCWNYLDIFSSAVSFVEVAIAPHRLSRSEGRYRGQCSQSCVVRRHSRRVK